MSDIRANKFAQIIVDLFHPPAGRTAQRPGGNHCGGTTLAEPLVSALYALIFERGGLPHLLFDLPGQEDIFFAHAKDAQVDFVPLFHMMAFEEFAVLIKIRSDANPRSLGSVDPARQARPGKRASHTPLLQAQLRYGAEKSLRWMSTLFPTNAWTWHTPWTLEGLS